MSYLPLAPPVIFLSLSFVSAVLSFSSPLNCCCLSSGHHQGGGARGARRRAWRSSGLARRLRTRQGGGRAAAEEHGGGCARRRSMASGSHRQARGRISAAGSAPPSAGPLLPSCSKSGAAVECLGSSSSSVPCSSSEAMAAAAMAGLELRPVRLSLDRLVVDRVGNFLD